MPSPARVCMLKDSARLKLGSSRFHCLFSLCPLSPLYISLALSLAMSFLSFAVLLRVFECSVSNFVYMCVCVRCVFTLKERERKQE